MKNHCRFLGSVFFIVSFLHISILSSAPRTYRYEDDSKIALREMRDSIEDLRQEVSNHESELKMFQEKLANQDSAMEALHQQMTDSQKAQKEHWKGNVQALENKIQQLGADFKTLKEHVAQTTFTAEQALQKLVRFEKIVDTQNQNLSHIETALNALMEGFQVKNPPLVVKAEKTEMESKTYKVKSGDSLGKIAVEHKTSLKALRELNPQLKDDKIFVGQTLHIP